jgi:hypothetical protein
MIVYIYVDSEFAYKTPGARYGGEAGEPDFNIDIEM